MGQGAEGWWLWLKIIVCVLCRVRLSSGIYDAIWKSLVSTMAIIGATVACVSR